MPRVSRHECRRNPLASAVSESTYAFFELRVWRRDGHGSVIGTERTQPIIAALRLAVAAVSPGRSIRAVVDTVDLAPTERLECVIMAWLDALATHRRVTRRMIWNKLEPGHVHYQVNGFLCVSRTVPWLREVAGRAAAVARV